MASLLALVAFNRVGAVRLSRFYSEEGDLGMPAKRPKLIEEISRLVITRSSKLSNLVDWRGYKIVYRRYASLFFAAIVPQDANTLLTLELIHFFVETLDALTPGAVCELDLVYSFQLTLETLDELFIDGKMQESAKRAVVRAVQAQVGEAAM
jgi:AP-1 complex subunit sigma 1/2